MTNDLTVKFHKKRKALVGSLLYLDRCLEEAVTRGNGNDVEHYEEWRAKQQRKLFSLEKRYEKLLP